MKNKKLAENYSAGRYAQQFVNILYICQPVTLTGSINTNNCSEYCTYIRKWNQGEIKAKIYAANKIEVKRKSKWLFKKK
jgi:hypothetical protein